MSLSQDSLIGKRKKKKEPIPNPLFVQWITNWRDDAASKGIKSQYTYNKVRIPYYRSDIFWHHSFTATGGGGGGWVSLPKHMVGVCN